MRPQEDLCVFVCVCVCVCGGGRHGCCYIHCHLPESHVEDRMCSLISGMCIKLGNAKYHICKKMMGLSL